MSGITPYGAAFSYGDITKCWKYQQALCIVKATGKDLKDYYLNLNCNKSSNSHDMVDPIYSNKYVLKFNGDTVASSTKIKFVDAGGNELGDNTPIYIGMSSFLRDNRRKDYFHKNHAHSAKASVTLISKWDITHPATLDPLELDGYYGNAFAFIYSVRKLGGYDSASPNDPMIDLTDASSIYKFNEAEHYFHENF